MGRPRNAILLEGASAQTALWAQTALSDGQRRIRARWDEARCVRSKGKPKDALKMLRAVETEVARDGDRREAARVEREIGMTLTRIDTAQAVAPLEHAVAVFAAERCPVEEAEAKYYLAQPHIDLGHSDVAERLLRKARRVFRREGLGYYVAMCDLEKAKWLEERTEYPTAIRLLEKVRENF